LNSAQNRCPVIPNLFRNLSKKQLKALIQSRKDAETSSA